MRGRGQHKLCFVYVFLAALTVAPVSAMAQTRAITEGRSGAPRPYATPAPPTFDTTGLGAPATSGSRTAASRPRKLGPCPSKLPASLIASLPAGTGLPTALPTGTVSMSTDDAMGMGASALRLAAEGFDAPADIRLAGNAQGAIAKVRETRAYFEKVITANATAGSSPDLQKSTALCRDSIRVLDAEIAILGCWASHPGLEAADAEPSAGDTGDAGGISGTDGSGGGVAERPQPSPYEDELDTVFDDIAGGTAGDKDRAGESREAKDKRKEEPGVPDVSFASRSREEHAITKEERERLAPGLHWSPPYALLPLQGGPATLGFYDGGNRELARIEVAWTWIEQPKEVIWSHGKPGYEVGRAPAWSIAHFHVRLVNLANCGEIFLSEFKLGLRKPSFGKPDLSNFFDLMFMHKEPDPWGPGPGGTVDFDAYGNWGQTEDVKTLFVVPECIFNTCSGFGHSCRVPNEPPDEGGLGDRAEEGKR